MTFSITIASGPDGPEPHLAPAGVAIAVVVHACHEKAIDAGLAHLAIPGLSRETLEPILTYCAELRCEVDGATCPGCKRRSKRAVSGTPLAGQMVLQCSNGNEYARGCIRDVCQKSLF